MATSPKLYIGIPILNEYENLAALVTNLSSQTYTNIEVVICINQPNSWWDNVDKHTICINNQKSIEYLQSFKDFPLIVIDKCSKGNGWSEKKKGVGQARKTIFDYISSKANDTDLIISLDADTSFSINYFQSIINQFCIFPNAIGMAIPYYHLLDENSEINRAILRYEIYMRYYLLNLFRIESPYAFTAIGSSIAFPVWAYKKVNGITPYEAGEDFYFIQKLCKTGNLLVWNKEKTYPSARISNRVPFGTGPSIEKGIKGDWNSNPIFSHTLFDKIHEAYNLFPQLYTQEIETPITSFLNEQLKTSEIWSSLRKNSKTINQFIRACHERVDGLRILQYFKKNHDYTIPDEDHLLLFLNKYFKKSDFEFNINNFSFTTSSINDLNLLRNSLEQKELELRYKHDYSNFK